MVEFFGALTAHLLLGITQLCRALGAHLQLHIAHLLCQLSHRSLVDVSHGGADGCLFFRLVRHAPLFMSAF